ncbi:DBH-like monooxygenase protein 2 homolog [Aplochiton taeniatus]
MALIPLLLCMALARPERVAGDPLSPPLPFMEHLDPEHLVTLRWGFSDVQGTITFQLSVNTTGWVGFGLSPNGDMFGADIVTGGIGTNGTYFTDRHGEGKFLPAEDAQQSYTVLSMTEVEGQTTMTFQRPIRLCDKDDFDISASPIKIIYAYGTTDEIKYHFNRRGTKVINLLRFMPKVSLPDSNYMNFTMNNVSVPPIHTYYHCRVMKLAQLNGKHHLYRIEPYIENFDMVHHMVLYRCPPTVTKSYDQACYGGDQSDSCFNVVAAWAIGGGAFELPENAGIPIGDGSNDVFYRLEMHYNNPSKEAGRTDSSGLRLYHTAKLREHDAGVLTVGLIVAMGGGYVIPPKAEAFHAYGMCNTSHFSQVLNAPVPDLQAFSVALHTHLAGRKVRAGLYRNGKQVNFLGVEENYDFEFQQTMNLGSITTIRPGDEIVVECTYSTVNRTGVTTLGLSTTDEMCLAFIIYYPAINISTCWSHPNMYYLAAISSKPPAQ